MEQIVRGIYYEDAYPGVVLGALIFPHGTIFIDAPLRAEDARTWRSLINELSIGQNRMLINLDAHLDRTIGARALDCSIVAHQKTAQVFRNRPTIFKGQTNESGAEWEVSNDVFGTRWALPDITFTHRLIVHWGLADTLLEHHPGPAPGSIWVIIPEEKVIFVGDTISLDQPPFLASADLPAWIESLELLHSKYKDFTVVSGRSGPVGADQAHAQLKMHKKILLGLEKLAARKAPPEATESLIAGILSDFSIPVKRREHYIQRLRHGLYYYYTQHYHTLEVIE